MILGVDPGYAKCGWSVVDERCARVVALGVIVTKQDDRLDVAADRAVRMGIVSAELVRIAREYSVTRVAGEEPLGHGAPAAIAANQLPWGAIVMLATVLGLELVMVVAKAWQRAVLDIEAGKVDYDVVEAMLAEYVGAQLAAVLKAIKKGDRTHGLDGTGIALFAALRPHAATRIIQRRSKAA